MLERRLHEKYANLLRTRNFAQVLNSRGLSHQPLSVRDNARKVSFVKLPGMLSL